MSEFLEEGSGKQDDGKEEEECKTAGGKISFKVPTRAIFTEKDLDAFKKSPTCAEIKEFVQACADAVLGVRISDKFHECEAVTKIKLFMVRAGSWLQDIPPLKQPMRFGNKAFRIWHQRLVAEAKPFIIDLLLSPSSSSSSSSSAIIKDLKVAEEAAEELAPYLCASFGNETRIDYGTGHELSIVIFFLCLQKLQVLQKEDLTAVVLTGFVSYVKTMRLLQTVYVLEPAGSHGVWGLDDYHCLTFAWGAAQLCANSSLTPASIHDVNNLRDYDGENRDDSGDDDVRREGGTADYLYFEGIAYIRRIKSSAPFAETSPMLNDISSLPDWPKVCMGLMRLFQGEVLWKLPVVQHLVFGTLLKCTWEVSVAASASASSSSSSEGAQGRGGATDRIRWDNINVAGMRGGGSGSGGGGDFGAMGVATAAPWAKK